MRSLVIIVLGTLFGLITGCNRAPRPHVGIAVHGLPSKTRINEWSETLGMKPDIIVFFTQWPSIENQQTADIPSSALSSILTEEIIPCMSWEPHVLVNGNEEVVRCESILTGQYDPYIQRMAETIRQLNKPVWIRFAHEMNLARYHWGVSADEYNEQAPEKYRQMFRYVVNKFREYGTQNVQWVFCPNSESIPVSDWNTIEAYWPGSDVVDILGVDGYNWGATQTVEKNGWNSEWRTFESIFEPAIHALHALDENTPLYVLETASVQRGPDRSRWIQQMIGQTERLKIRGICWFQTEKENAWALDSKQDCEGLMYLKKWSRKDG